jgi:hypothetical protein
MGNAIGEIRWETALLIDTCRQSHSTVYARREQITPYDLLDSIEARV